MKKGVVVAMCFALALSLSGCKKKAAQESTDAINLDTLETTSTAPQQPAAQGQISLDSTTPQGTPAAAASTMPATPAIAVSGPNSKDAQTALKNAGYYSGAIDGKFGPKSKAALKEFQTANGLTPDGKYSGKTWIKLSGYLSGSSTAGEQPAVTPEPVTTVTTTTVKKSKKTSAHRDVSTPPGAE